MLWWTVVAIGQELPFQPPELQLADAVQIALGNNRPVQIAKLDLDKSGWEVAEVQTSRLPSLNTQFLASGDVTSPTFTLRHDLGTL
jgi:outer membrane protein TolC